jgi:hypothetical protein
MVGKSRSWVGSGTGGFILHLEYFNRRQSKPEMIEKSVSFWQQMMSSRTWPHVVRDDVQFQNKTKSKICCSCCERNVSCGPRMLVPSIHRPGTCQHWGEHRSCPLGAHQLLWPCSVAPISTLELSPPCVLRKTLFLTQELRGLQENILTPVLVRMENHGKEGLTMGFWLTSWEWPSLLAHNRDPLVSSPKK